MNLRCFLFKYASGEEVMRWFDDDGCPWIQQVFKMHLGKGELEYTGGDGTAVVCVEGFPQLLEAGLVVEL